MVNLQSTEFNYTHFSFLLVIKEFFVLQCITKSSNINYLSRAKCNTVRQCLTKLFVLFTSIYYINMYYYYHYYLTLWSILYRKHNVRQCNTVLHFASFTNLKIDRIVLQCITKSDRGVVIG